MRVSCNGCAVENAQSAASRVFLGIRVRIVSDSKVINESKVAQLPSARENLFWVLEFRCEQDITETR